MNDSLTLAIVGHLVGDYLLQNDWMAQHKKKDPRAATLHALIWTACVFTWAGWWFVEFWSAMLAWMFLYLCHFWQDHTEVVRWLMNKMGQRHFATGPCAPWSVIIVDNTWHLLQIVVVWAFIMKVNEL